jgi:hypothetical protein
MRDSRRLLSQNGTAAKTIDEAMNEAIGSNAASAHRLDPMTVATKASKKPNTHTGSQA